MVLDEHDFDSWLYNTACGGPRECEEAEGTVFLCLLHQRELLERQKAAEPPREMAVMA